MKSITTLALSALLLLSSNANAGLIGVNYIEITNELNTWLQVAEVVATDMSNNDVALTSEGAVATAPDSWSVISGPEKAIDGITLGNYSLGQIFHEGSNNTHDTLTITFASLQELNSIQVFGRTDCCQNRDLFRVTFFGEQQNALYSTVIDSRTNGVDPIVVLPNTQVPEPSTIAIFALGLLGLASRKYQK
ncbi:MAG: PEP-CTERM sorting domain-containing protein [Colwellia sp.]|nr:PEP-CTERM sorting domain-containing protein [Colwellia sp.]MCW9083219.1 PEP-CTERM sorting domain-containing protein [Colwellia sp.]